MFRLLVVAAATAASGLVLVTVTGAASTPAPALNTLKYTLSVDEVQTDLSGRVLSTATRTTTGDTVSSPTPAARPGTTDQNPVDPAHAAGGGCATLNVHIRTSDPLFDYGYWTYNSPAHWCWPYIGGNMNWYPQNAYFSNVATGWQNAEGMHAANGYFYAWRGNGQAGHYSLRQGKIDEVIPFTSIVVANAYPTIELWATGPYWTAKKDKGY